MNKILLFLTAMMITATSADAQFSMVKDIGTSLMGSGSSPGSFTSFNGAVYFSAAMDVTGNELWKSDGTPGGTVLLKDLNPGQSAGNPRAFAASSNYLFFIAELHTNPGQTSIWRTDGTEAGTIMLKTAIAPAFTVMNGLAYFMDGSDLWKTDGTVAGTMLVKTIANTTTDIYSNKAIYSNDNTLFFASGENSTGLELWKSDGTGAGTMLVKDIYPGTSGANPRNFISLNNNVYFIAPGPAGTELWKTDGTDAGTMMVKDIYPGAGSSSPSMPIVFNNKLVFAATHPTFSRVLWTSDGTDAGTTSINNVFLANNFSEIVEVNGSLFFSGYSPATGYELWKSDGTAAGSMMVRDIYPGNTGSDPAYLVNFNGSLFFCADHPVSGFELWTSDGTDAGTMLVKDTWPGYIASKLVKNLVVANGKIWFSSSELWVSDGTQTGTNLFKTLNATNSGSDPRSLTDFNGTLFFSAGSGPYSSGNNAELWKSDGTTSGTTLVKDINTTPGQSNSNPDKFRVINSTLYFWASEDVHGTELWKTDGTNGGTILVKDIEPGTASSNGRNPTVFNNQLFFYTPSGNERGLWKSDGTEAGTTMVKDLLHFGPGFGDITNSVPILNGQMIFQSSTAANGMELWKSDGTTAGTVLLKDISPGAANSAPSGFTMVGSFLYFIAFDNSGFANLWKTDGTEPGTVFIKTIGTALQVQGTGTGKVFMANVNGTLFFALDNPNLPRKRFLWTSDGTAAGTVIIKEFALGTGGFGPVSPCFTAFNSNLFFVGYDDSHGWELWKSDGTAANTVLVKDFTPGISSGLHAFANLAVIGDYIFLTANDGIHGEELWRSDGTETGTYLLQDIAATGGSTPFGIMRMGNKLFMRASTEAYGNELWSSPDWVANLVIPGQVELCPPTASTSLTSTATGSSYQWQVSVDSTSYNNLSDNILRSGTSTPTLLLNNIPSSWYGYWFRCLVDGAVSQTFSIRFVATWTGSQSSAWENPANWACNSVPDASTDVIINAGAAVINSNVTIRTLTVLPGASVTVAAGYNLTVLR